MPRIDEIKRGQKIGKVPYRVYIWHACVDCGKQQWVQLLKGNLISNRCPSCANKRKSQRGEKHHSWKGGRRKRTDGYILVKLQPDDFFYPMAQKNGCILEHRLVVAKALNRCLLPWELVHHKGAKYPLGSMANKSDNRYPENLELIKGHGRHNTHFERELRRQAKEIETLQERATLLEAEVILLTEQLNEAKISAR